MRGLKVTSDVTGSGPPSTGGAIGINLIAEKSSDLPELIRVAKDFEGYIASIPETKNIVSSSKDTPGQFVFRLKGELAAQKDVPPALLYATINQETKGIVVGSIEDRGEDMDIILKNTAFDGDVSPDDILSIPFHMGNMTYRIGDFLTVSPQNATEHITRKDGDISITVGADVTEAGNALVITDAIMKYAESYTFPAGIRYTSGGENTENADLIIAMVSALFLSIVVILGILVLQFDSFAQPIIVFYSVIMALPFVFIGLLVTGNPFSLMFMIGFISFMGIAVNHGIILIDAANQNLKKGMDIYTALVEAGASRLEPMVLTTVTTILGMLPIALKDKMWAGMGFTIIFGIMATTLITLFTVKGICYELYLRKQNSAGK